MAQPLLIDDFNNGINPHWKAKEFAGITRYKPIIEDGVPCLKAFADGTASGMFYEINYNPEQQQILTWKWKIDNIVENGNVHTKAGDDYAARIYVVFPSVFFWKTRALNYIWANQLPKGKAVKKIPVNGLNIAATSTKTIKSISVRPHQRSGQ